MPSRFYTLFFAALVLAALAGYSIGREVSPAATSLAPPEGTAPSPTPTPPSEEETFQVAGTVSSVQNGTLTVATAGGSSMTILTDEDTAFFPKDGAPRTFAASDVAVGNAINAFVLVDGDAVRALGVSLTAD